MQAEQLPATEREHGVVKAPDLLVLVENGLGGQQLAVPASGSLQISHGYGDAGDRRGPTHCGLLVGWKRGKCCEADAPGSSRPRFRPVDVDVSSSPRAASRPP